MACPMSPEVKDPEDQDPEVAVICPDLPTNTLCWKYPEKSSIPDVPWTCPTLMTKGMLGLS